MTITPQDMIGAGQGLTETMTRQNTAINTSSATTVIQNLFGGLDFKFSVQMQRNSASKAIDQILEGVEYEVSTTRAGYERILFADRTGDPVPTYSVVVRTMSGAVEKYIDYIPNCEIICTAQGSRDAGSIYNKTLEFMAMPLDDEIGTKFERFRKI
jgi:hypothetical protein